MRSEIKYLLIILGAVAALILLSLFVPIDRSGTTRPDLNVVETDISGSQPLTTLSGFVAKKGPDYIYVRAGNGQDVPVESLRNVLVTRETKIQRITPGETDNTGYVVGSKINNISFNQVPMGARVVITSQNSADISKKAVFEAESVSIIEGEF